MSIAKTRHQRIPAHVSATLDRAQRTREVQLDQLPRDPDDLVLAAHRASVQRILANILTAQRLLAEGTYGICTRCGSDIPVERLELRAWTTLCVRCSGRT